MLVESKNTSVYRQVLDGVASSVSLSHAQCFISQHCVMRNLLANFSLKSFSNGNKEPYQSKIC